MFFWPKKISDYLDPNLFDPKLIFRSKFLDQKQFLTQIFVTQKSSDPNIFTNKFLGQKKSDQYFFCLHFFTKILEITKIYWSKNEKKINFYQQNNLIEL